MELTREGEVPVWGVESPVVSGCLLGVLEVIPNRHVHVTYMRLGTMFGIVFRDDYTGLY